MSLLSLLLPTVQMADPRSLRVVPAGCTREAGLLPLLFLYFWMADLRPLRLGSSDTLDLALATRQ